MNFLNKSIFNQLVASMCLALLLSMFASTVITNTLLEKMIDERLTQENLPTILREISNDIERELATPLAVSKSIATNANIKAWMENGEYQDQLGGVSQYLSSALTSFEASTVFVVSSLTNTYYHEKGVLKRLNPSESRDKWFYKFVKSGKEFSVDIDVDEATQKSTVFINYAIKINGVTQGVGGIGKTLDQMTDLISNYRIGETGFVFLVDKKGDVKLHPDRTISGKTNLNKIPNVGPVAGSLLGGEKFQFAEFEQGGEDFVLASLPIESLGWSVVAQLPKNELYAAMRAVLLKTMLAGIVIAVVFVGVIVMIARGIVKPIQTVAESLTIIGKQGGDLTNRLATDRQDELGSLSVGFNAFAEKLQRIIQQVMQICGDLEQSLKIVNSVVTNTSQRAEDQQAKTELVATAVNQMGATVQEIARNANDTAQYTATTKTEAESGTVIVNNAISNINSLSDEMDSASMVVKKLAGDVNAISSVLDVIRGISEQTNLLALNAAIEAARAGEQGRGFAVVADEVRTLAQRTQESTEEIRSTIEKLQSGAQNAVDSMDKGKKVTEDGVQLVERAGSSLHSITANIDEINSMSQQIAVATEEQTTVTEDIARNIVHIADIAKSAAEDVQQCRDSCQQMESMAQELFGLMRQFKV